MESEKKKGEGRHMCDRDTTEMTDLNLPARNRSCLQIIVENNEERLKRNDNSNSNGKIIKSAWNLHGRSRLKIESEKSPEKKVGKIRGTSKGDRGEGNRKKETEERPTEF